MALSAIALNESHSPPPTSTSRRWLGSRAFCELRKRRAERVKDMHALSTMLDEYLTVILPSPRRFARNCERGWWNFDFVWETMTILWQHL